MRDCEAETVSGFNAYIKGLKEKDDGTMRFTLTQFDSMGIDILHDGVKLKEVIKMSGETYQPRANTPLYDAIGQTIQATKKKAGEKYKVLFVTLTDGLENASSDWDEEKVRAEIKACENKLHWTFAHIGVGVLGWAATRGYSTGTQSASNMLHIERKHVKRAHEMLKGSTISYAANVGSSSATVTGFWGNKEEEE